MSLASAIAKTYRPDDAPKPAGPQGKYWPTHSRVLGDCLMVQCRRCRRELVAFQGWRTGKASRQREIDERAAAYGFANGVCHLCREESSQRC